MSFAVSNVLKAYCENNMAVPYGDPILGKDGCLTKCKSVYIPFQSAGPYSAGIQKSYYFQPDSELDGNNAIIKGLEIVIAVTSASFYAQGEIRDNIPQILATPLSTGVLYISNDSREIIATIPIIDLDRTENNGKLFRTHFTRHLWQNCYLEFTDATSISPSVGIQLNVYYEERRK